MNTRPGDPEVHAAEHHCVATVAHLHVEHRGGLVAVLGRRRAGAEGKSLYQKRIYQRDHSAARAFLSEVVGVGDFDIVHDEQVFAGR